MDKPTSVTNSSIKYHSSSYGIQYYGSSAAKLTLNNNNILYNKYGVYLSGNFVTAFSYNSINHNTDFGIYANGADVYLANTRGVSAGQNSIYSNKYAIKMGGSTSYFYLNNGYNDLRSDTYCMYGTAGQMSGGNVYAHHNVWKSGGGAPVNNTHYILSGSSSTITLLDYYPERFPTACIAPGPIGDPMSAAPSSGTFREVSTSEGTMPLNESVNTILNDDASTGSVYTQETQTELLGEVLMNDLSQANEGEEWYINHAYNMYKSGATIETTSSQKGGSNKAARNLEVIRKLEKEQSHKKVRRNKYSEERFAFNIDDANALWYNGNYDEALVLLGKLLTKVDGDLFCQAQKMICQINADRAFVESNNNLNIDELMAACEECDESRKVGTTNPYDGTNETGELENGLYAELTLSVMPHPVNGSSKIQLIGLQQAGKITIYNSTGAIVFSEKISTQVYSHQVSNSELTPGIYLIAIDVNGSIGKTTKMVVTE